jgi:acetylornithine deacetylase/succinyl-diaminopimelate desuccinylase-like protein
MAKKTKPASVASSSLPNPKTTQSFVSNVWDSTIVPTLVEYIKIPNKSPGFDSKWREHGHMDRAVALIEGWCKKRPIAGLSVRVVRQGERTPLIYMEIPAFRCASKETVLLYGHLDKQPEMVGWGEGLGPWLPVIRGDKLYGRGGADDGYAAFASLTAIEALQKQGLPHARCVVLIEACEESGSGDLPFYVDHLKKQIGSPNLIVCLDSGCGNYDQLWLTTSLRGLVIGILTVDVLEEGVHSGDASGIVASSFRLARQLLSRIEDERTGEIRPKDFYDKIPAERRDQARLAAKVLGKAIYSKFPFVKGMRPVEDDPEELILNRTWRPALAITGAEGLPAVKDGGNVLRPRTTLKLSLRLPPTLSASKAQAKFKSLLEKDPPYGARVKLDTKDHAGSGWNAPQLQPWLQDAVRTASQSYYGKPPVYMGEGGSIPFMGMLGEKFPRAQFLITGVLGPGSNAHGPNEFLHVPYAKRLTCCVAHVMADHAST